MVELVLREGTVGMKDVDELLRSLREHGTVDSEGQFTVSLSQARRKLKHFHSSDPARFLLLLVSSGIASGATSIKVERAQRSLHLWCEDAYLPEGELLQTLEKPQSVNPNSGAGDLVAGIQGSFTQRAASVQVEVLHPQKRSYSWTLLPSSEESHEVRAEGRRGMEIWVRFEPRWDQRLKSLFTSLRGYAGMPPEERLVDRFADRSLVPITLDGQMVNRALVLPDSVASAVIGEMPENRVGSPFHVTWEGRDWRGVLALSSSPVQLVVNGISYCQIESLGVGGVVYCDNLIRDASREKIVQNAAYNSLVQDLQEHRWRLFELLAERIESLTLDQARPYLPPLLSAFLAGRLPADARRQIWSWMVGQVPDRVSSSLKPSVDGLVRLIEVLLPEGRDRVIADLLDECADATAADDSRALQLTRTTNTALRALAGPRDHLLEGYLLLASGALHALKGDKISAEKSWFEALNTAWSCPSQKAQELFHVHLGYPEAHIARQAASVLRMYSRVWAPSEATEPSPHFKPAAV